MWGKKGAKDKDKDKDIELDFDMIFGDQSAPPDEELPKLEIPNSEEPSKLQTPHSGERSKGAIPIPKTPERSTPSILFTPLAKVVMQGGNSFEKYSKSEGSELKLGTQKKIRKPSAKQNPGIN